MRTAGTEMIAQRAFRRLLQAMSRPGRVFALPPAAVDGRWGPMLTLLESLLDHEVSFAVIGDEGPQGLGPLIAERTRSRVAPPREADFLIVAGGDSGGEILRARRGTLQYPDASATVVYRVQSLLLAEGNGPRVTLSGPGIRKEIRLGEIRGLAPGELGRLREANAEFPLGVDAVFIDDAGRILCIPRSTRIRLLEG
ncbi:MAG: phosphonate C-P lyase system protein PhnH [Syntrophaceae bacterium]|nr:phosphonate C-P lyase system protein PhnH [Syntrophaceae bacterium]